MPFPPLCLLVLLFLLLFPPLPARSLLDLDHPVRALDPPAPLAEAPQWELAEIASEPPEECARAPAGHMARQ